MINLLPDDLKQDFYYGRKNSQIIRWLLTVVFGIIILIVVAAVGRLTIQTAKNQTVVQKQVVEDQLKKAQFDEISSDYADFTDGLGSVKKLYQQQILYSRLIRKLGTLLPPGAKLTNISISDKDRAIGLNFDNSSEGLGPTIQLNLTDQGKQIADNTKLAFNDSLRTPIASSGDVAIDKDKKIVNFFVSIPSPEQEKILTKAVQNGGEMAFAIAYSALDAPNARHLVDYARIQSADTNNDGSLSATEKESIAKIEDNEFNSRAQIRSYSVNTSQKYVDFTVRADSIAEAKTLESALVDSANSQFIETYVFEDSTYTGKQKCKDAYSTKQTCTIQAGICSPSSRNGCQYTVRAYYDELYKTATLRKATDSEVKKCTEQGKPCSHAIQATYSQLFSKVDINRVATCTTDPTTKVSTCPVEMRAEFSSDAKFYLISPSGSTSQ